MWSWPTGGLESRLAVFSPEGRPLGTIGRQGDGPGEYGWIMSVLGSTRGEYDEERVELWPFEERPAESADILSACRPSER